MVQQIQLFSARLKRKYPEFGDMFFNDEVFVNIKGQRFCLWRAVDQDVDDSNLQRHRASADSYGARRARAFESWNEAVAA